MRDKRIILCDADDTIENLCQTWVTHLNGLYGTTVHSSEIVDWNVSLFFPSLTKEQVYDPIFNKNFWKEINPIDGCYKVLEAINKRDELYIITATNYQTCDTKIERILEMYPFLKWSQFIITERKQLVYGDWLIDDGVHNFDGGVYEGILMSQPHNKNFNAEENGLIRVHGWDEIGKILL